MEKKILDDDCLLNIGSRSFKKMNGGAGGDIDILRTPSDFHESLLVRVRFFPANSQ